MFIDNLISYAVRCHRVQGASLHKNTSVLDKTMFCEGKAKVTLSHKAFKSFLKH
jgi:hypothetical protein